MATKKLWTILSVLCISCALHAADITGKVLDATTRQALDFVNVSIAKQGDSTPISGTVTDGEGVFALTNIKNGKYTVTVSFMGYTTLTKQVEVTKTVDLGKLYLKEDTQNLQEVAVVGQGSEVPQGHGRRRAVWQDGHRLQGLPRDDQGRHEHPHPHLPLGVGHQGSAYRGYREQQTGPWIPH